MLGRMSAQLIDGKALAAGILERVRLQRTALGKRPLRLVSIYVGDDPSSAVYIRNQRRACERMEIRFDLDHLPATTAENELVDHIHALNADESVTGILLQRPLPAQIRQLRAQAKIHPDKDVEGLNPANIGSIVYGAPKLVPCTALAAVRCLRSTGRALRGADVVFTAVGKPGLLTGAMLKPGCVVIDIGIKQVPQLAPDGRPAHDAQGRPLFRIAGDADFESVREVAGWITPVPGGVGPVTVAMLVHNCVVAARLQAGMPPDSGFAE